jgi:hypothetical protein
LSGASRISPFFIAAATTVLASIGLIAYRRRNARRPCAVFEVMGFERQSRREYEQLGELVVAEKKRKRLCERIAMTPVAK